MKQKVFFLRGICIILLFVSLVSCGSSKIEQFSGRDFIYEPQPDALKFNELWGYVMNGREKEFNTQIPLSDIVYSIAPISILSEVRQPATKSTFFGDFPGRVHIVSSCDSTAQAHLILDPTLPLREKIISGLVKAAETYDGLQIDWEYMPLADTANFHSFLRELKKQLGDKMLSVAVKARVRTIKNIPSLLKRCKMCSDLGVNKLAFWRIGFEDVKFWQHMKLNEPFLNEINLDEQEHSEDIEYAQD